MELDQYLVPQRSDSLHCRDLLEGDGEGIACVPVWVGPDQAADLHKHFINCTAWEALLEVTACLAGADVGHTHSLQESTNIGSTPSCCTSAFLDFKEGLCNDV